MPPGTPVGPSIRALPAYPHHSHHVGYEQLTGLCREVFGLKISGRRHRQCAAPPGAGLRRSPEEDQEAPADRFAQAGHARRLCCRGRARPRYRARKTGRLSGRPRSAASNQSLARQFFVFLADPRVPATNNGYEHRSRLRHGPGGRQRPRASPIAGSWAPNHPTPALARSCPSAPGSRHPGYRPGWHLNPTTRIRPSPSCPHRPRAP